MARTDLEVGHFPGSIPYTKVGRGTKNILFLNGGPGNDPANRMEASMCLGGLKSVTDEYAFWITSRKNGQPENYGTREMAADTATVIKDFFAGGVEAAMGMSYGGLIAQYLATDFPGLVPKYVFVATAYRCSTEVAEADLRFAEHLAAGRNSRAFYEVGGYLFPPGLKRSLLRGLLFLVGAFMSSEHHRDYRTDVIKEARMEEKHNSLTALGAIADSVLLVGGACDLAFPKDLLEETAAAIPGSRLIIYEGRGHGGVTSHRRFAQDVLEFLR